MEALFSRPAVPRSTRLGAELLLFKLLRDFGREEVLESDTLASSVLSSWVWTFSSFFLAAIVFALLSKAWLSSGLANLRLPTWNCLSPPCDLVNLLLPRSVYSLSFQNCLMTPYLYYRWLLNTNLYSNSHFEPSLKILLSPISILLSRPRITFFSLAVIPFLT